MKIEFRFNGRCEIHLTPENEEEDFHLTMIAKRAEKGASLDLVAVAHIQYTSVVIGVDR